MGTVVYIAGWTWIGILAFTAIQSARLYFRDRTGLSGRFGNERDNRRLDGPDDLQ